MRCDLDGEACHLRHSCYSITMQISFIDEIKAKLDLVEIIRETVPLQKAGANWKAKCPFHTEKTPSFMVSAQKQIWHCFGCGKGGDIFDFIKLSEAVDFPEALRILAARAGVTLRHISPQMQSEKTRLLEILDAASKFFKTNLRSETGKVALEYLFNRGLDDHTLDLFEIGFAPVGWDKLLLHLRSKGFKDNEIEKAGLLVPKRSGGYVDRFRARIMFGLRDYHGRTVGFTGRLLPGDEASAGKYVNTPSTLLYDKSRLLYNMDLAKHEIKKQNYAIVVEGQMDAIAAYSAKTQNVVASSGTALTSAHLDIIGKLTKNIMFAFDTDRAGLEATDRGVELALARGFSVKVITISTGKDPDDCIRKNKKDWYQALKNALPYLQFFSERVLRNYDITKIEQKKKATELLLKKLLCIQNPVEKEYWVGYISARLGISEAALVERMNQLSKKIPDARQSKTTIPQAPTGGVEERLMALILEEEIIFTWSAGHVLVEFFDMELFQNLYKKAIIHYNNGDFENFAMWKNNFINSLTDEEKNKIATLDLLFSKEFSQFDTNTLMKEARSYAALLKKSYSQKRLRQLQDQIIQAEKEGNREKVQYLMESFSILSQQLKDFW